MRNAPFAAVVYFATAQAVQADVVVTFTEDIVLSQTFVRATGSLTTTAFPSMTTGYVLGAPLVHPSGGQVSLMAPGIAPHMRVYRFVPPGSFPSFGGGDYQYGTYLGSHPFVFWNNGSLNSLLAVPYSYESEAPIDAAVLFNGTFSSLGIAPSEYQIRLPGDQSISFKFVTVPGPSGTAIFCVAGAFAARRRRSGLPAH